MQLQVGLTGGASLPWCGPDAVRGSGHTTVVIAAMHAQAEAARRTVWSVGVLGHARRCAHPCPCVRARPQNTQLRQRVDQLEQQLRAAQGAVLDMQVGAGGVAVRGVGAHGGGEPFNAWLQIMLERGAVTVAVEGPVGCTGRFTQRPLRTRRCTRAQNRVAASEAVLNEAEEAARSAAEECLQLQQVRRGAVWKLRKRAGGGGGGMCPSLAETGLWSQTWPAWDWSGFRQSRGGCC